jgi:hypothetical protein
MRATALHAPVTGHVREHEGVGYRAIAIGAICFFAVACGEEVTAPKRPAIVPATAVWAGGSDGGAWLDCTAIEPTSKRYRCTTYEENAGEVWAQGEYVIRSAHWDQAAKRASYRPVDQAPAALQYTFFDGDIIHLAPPLVLVPDGWINHPFEKGGKKQLYEMGEPRGNEISYD